MLKTFLAGATALAIAGGAYAYAQQSSTVGAGGEFQRVRHARMSAEDAGAIYEFLRSLPPSNGATAKRSPRCSHPTVSITTCSTARSKGPKESPR